MNWEELDKNLIPNLYTLWNRLTSGSYFPQPVKETEIDKKDGGVRKLGIPTILDRIAQQVVKTHLEWIVEPLFSFYTFVIEQEEPYEGRLSRTVPWERRGETPLRDPTRDYYTENNIDNIN
ncbi:MAG: hypothetical protein PHF97_12615 [Bacteroidales bacterium]|nr:hypothetical protein [Bacteroidales bacterium]